MPKNQTKDFLDRKARVVQALKSEKKNWVESYQGISTIKRITDATEIDEQSVKRIIKNLQKEGKVKVIETKSHVILLEKSK
jgi:DNA repair photolyase